MSKIDGYIEPMPTMHMYNAIKNALGCVGHVHFVGNTLVSTMYEFV